MTVHCELNMNAVTALWQRRLRSVIRAVDLSHAQFALLASLGWLAREGRTVTQIQIAHHAKTDIMVTSSVLRALEARGLISRAQHPRDARAKILTLLPAGQDLIRRALVLVEEADAQFFAPLGPALEDFNGQLQRLTEDRPGPR